MAVLGHVLVEFWSSYVCIPLIWTNSCGLIEVVLPTVASGCTRMFNYLAGNDELDDFLSSPKVRCTSNAMVGNCNRYLQNGLHP